MILRLVLSFYFLCFVTGNSWTRKYSNSPQEPISGDDKILLCANDKNPPEAIRQNDASGFLGGTRKELDDHTHSDILEKKAEKETDDRLELTGLTINSENATTASDQVESTTDQDFTIFFQDEPSSEQDETRRDMNIIIPGLSGSKNTEVPQMEKEKCYSALNLKRVVKGVLQHIKKHPSYVDLLIQELQLEIEKEPHLFWFKNNPKSGTTSSVLNQFHNYGSCPPQLMTLATQAHKAYLQLKEFQPCLDVMFGYLDDAESQDGYVKETSPELSVLIATLLKQLDSYKVTPQLNPHNIHITIPEVNLHQVQFEKQPIIVQSITEPVPDIIAPEFIIEEPTEPLIEPKYLESEYQQPQILEPQIIEVPQYLGTQYIESHDVEPQYIESQYIEPQNIKPQYVELQNVVPTTLLPMEIEPQTIEPQYIEAQFIKPDYSEPLVIEPQFIIPQVQQPSEIEPNYVLSQYIRPTSIEPQDIEPQYIEPEFLSPVYVEQQDLQPQYIQLQDIEPQYIRPLPTEPYIIPEEINQEKSPEETPSPTGYLPEKEKPDSKPEFNPKSDASPQQQPRPFLEPEKQLKPQAHWPFTDTILPGSETEMSPEILIEPQDHFYVEEPTPIYEQPIYYEEPVYIQEPVYYEEPMYVEEPIYIEDAKQPILVEPKPTSEAEPINVEAPIDVKNLQPVYVESKPNYETKPLYVKEPNYDHEPIYTEKPIHADESPSIFIEPTSAEIHTEEPQSIYVTPTPIDGLQPIYIEEPINEKKPVYIEQPEYIYVDEPTNQYKPIYAEEPTYQKPNYADEPEHIYIQEPTTEHKPIHLEEPPQFIVENPTNEPKPIYVEEPKHAYIEILANEDVPIYVEKPEHVYVEEPSNQQIPIYEKPMYGQGSTNEDRPIYDEVPSDEIRPIYVEVPTNTPTSLYDESPTDITRPVYVEIPNNDQEPLYIEEPSKENIPVYIEIPDNEHNPTNEDGPIYYDNIPTNDYETIYVDEPINEQRPIYIEEPTNEHIPIYDDNPQKVYVEPRPTSESIPIYIEPSPTHDEPLKIESTPTLVESPIYVEEPLLLNTPIYIEPTPPYVDTSPNFDKLKPIYIKATPSYIQEPKPYEEFTPTYVPIYIQSNIKEPIDNSKPINVQEPQPFVAKPQPNNEMFFEVPIDVELEPTYQPMYGEKPSEELTPVYTLLEPTHEPKPSSKLKFIPPLIIKQPDLYTEEPKPLNVEPDYVDDSVPIYIESTPDTYPNHNIIPPGELKFISPIYNEQPDLYIEEPKPTQHNIHMLSEPDLYPIKNQASSNVGKLILQLIRDNPHDLTDTLVKILKQNRSVLNPKLYKLFFALIDALAKGEVDSKRIHEIIYFLIEPPKNKMWNNKKKQLLWHLLPPNENGEIDSEITDDILMLINVPEEDSKSLLLMDEILPLLKQIKNGHVAHKSIAIIQNLLNGDRNHELTSKQIENLLLLIKPNKKGSIPKKHIDIAITLSNWNKIPYLDSNIIEIIFSLMRPNKNNKIDNRAIEILHEILTPKKSTFLTRKDITLILSFLKTKPGEVIHRKRLNLVLFMLKNFSRAPRLTDSFIKLLVDSDIDKSKYVDIILYLHKKQLLTLRLFEALISLIRQEQTGYVSDNNINNILSLLEPYKSTHPKIVIDIYNILHPGDIVSQNVNSNGIPENMKVLLYYLLNSGKVPKVQSLQTPLSWKGYNQSGDQKMLKLNLLTKILQLLQWNQKKASATESMTHDYGVIELTYMLKHQKPLMYHPVYYVKYKVPVINFLTNIKSMLTSDSKLNIDPSKLLQELIIEGDVSEISPNLKGFRKEDILDLTFKDGNLIQAKVLDEKSLRLNEQVKLIHNINSDVTPEEILQQNKLNAINYFNTGKLNKLKKNGGLEGLSNYGSLRPLASKIGHGALQKITQQLSYLPLNKNKKRPEAPLLHIRSGNREEEEEKSEDKTESER